MATATSIFRGQSLHIPDTGPAHDRARGHLCVVLTDVSDDDKCLVVPICTAHDRCDKSCLLHPGDPGDHRFLTRESFVMYSQCRFYLGSYIAIQIAAGIIEDKGSVDASVLQRIDEGLSITKMIAPIYRRFFLSQSAP